jgi:hypothetical protein
MKREDLRDPPEPTAADKKYQKQRDNLMERAGRRLSKIERETREREEYLSQRRSR